MKPLLHSKITLPILLIGLLFSSCSQRATEQETLPNILLIVTDDQAYGDLSITQNPIAETPILDSLATGGVFANNFYVSPVCAPTRASLLTGRYHQRTGVSGVTRGREDMNLDETTLADILKQNGYRTGIFGKWHNGAHYPFHPMGRGFDNFVGFTSGHWPNYFNTTIEKNGKPFKTEGYLPNVLTNEALGFITQSKTENAPFFCYLPYQTPHTPLQVPDKYFNKYKNKGADDFNATIYGMGENIDDNVGKILEKLEALHIRENTIIIYLSDNGPLNFRFNAGLKGRKGMVDQGGVKVPFILNWESHIAGGTIIETPLAHIDLLPTLLDLVGISHENPKPIDGRSFKSLLNGNKDFADRKLFMEWSRNKRVLSNNYLLINEELFDLEIDPGQTTDIRNNHPEVYDSLTMDYEEWLAAMPLENKTKPIPLGYCDYPVTVLPAHEANLFPPFEFRKDRKHTGIAYHSLYGWAHDWIDFWTKTSAYATWDINVVEEGTFEIELKYALDSLDSATQLRLEIDDQKIIIDSLKPFEHGEFKNYDRVTREQEAPETDWERTSIGTLNLSEGIKTIKISALKIPGKKSIELKEILITKKP